MKSGTGTQTPTRAVRILAILVESGVFYILIGVSSALVSQKHESSPGPFSSLFRLWPCSLLRLRVGNPLECLATYLCPWVYSLLCVIASRESRIVLIPSFDGQGMYPILVLILVEQNRSLTSTYCSFGTIIDVRGVQPSQLESMSFAPGPIIASGDHN